MISSAIGQTVDNLRENYPTFTAGIVMTSFSLVILGTFVLVYLNLIHLTGLAFQKSQYSVFLTDQVSESERTNILRHVRSIPDVIGIEEISSSQAREQLIASFKDARDMLSQIEFPEFPDIIEFALGRAGSLTREETQKLQNLSGVQEVITGRETRDQVNTFFTIARFVGVFLIVLLIVCMMLIIYNTIHVAIRMRIREIEIFKTLGASPHFIRLPYILEGVLISLVSCLFSLALVYFLYSFVVAGITFNEATYPLRDLVRFYSVTEIIAIVLGFVCLGTVSAYLAANRIITRLDV